jgi:predicted RecB family nuclease
MRVLENTSMAVTIRYDGVLKTLDDATTAARKACAAYDKTAQLRRNEVIAIAERYAHFDCVSRR